MLLVLRLRGQTRLAICGVRFGSSGDASIHGLPLGFFVSRASHARVVFAGGRVGAARTVFVSVRESLHRREKECDC